MKRRLDELLNAAEATSTLTCLKRAVTETDGDVLGPSSWCFVRRFYCHEPDSVNISTYAVNISNYVNRQNEREDLHLHCSHLVAYTYQVKFHDYVSLKKVRIFRRSMCIWCSDCETEWVIMSNNPKTWEFLVARYFDFDTFYKPKILPYGTLTGVPAIYQTHAPHFVDLCCSLPYLPFEVILLLYKYVCCQAVLVKFNPRTFKIPPGTRYQDQ